MKFQVKDKTGMRFGMLLVIEEDTSLRNGKFVYWRCRCDCGREISVLSGELRPTRPRACGCQMAKKKHGLCGTRIHRIHSLMIDRCTNPNSKRYKYYGGKGISVCAEWMESVAAFHRDMGDPPEGMSLDRIDVNGNYCKENCRWATQKQQMRNTTRSRLLTIDGVTKTMVEWSEQPGAQSYSTIRNRVRCGFDHKVCVFAATEELG